jgi:hypothetical protein
MLSNQQQGKCKVKLKTYIMTLLPIFGLLLISNCGGAGSKSSGGGGGSVSQVVGNILSQTGRESGYDGWMMVLVEKETGESRVGEIDAKGSYFFTNVKKGKTYTMLLLSQDFKINAVLSMVSGTYEGKVHQYFKIKGSSIPTIVHKGQNFEFSDISQVDLQNDISSDGDADGIPDGLETETADQIGVPSTGSSDSIPRGPSFSLAKAIDTDTDGIVNTEDPDIDGDGLPNWFDDDDDDTNDTYDVFDIDANADGVLDVSQKLGDHYFGDDVEYIAVQRFTQPSGGSTRNFLKFTVKTSQGLNPVEIRVRGEVNLLNESQLVTENEMGDLVAGDLWDFTLKDDGLNQDGTAKDGIYSRKVELQTGKVPKKKQVVFLQLGFGSADAPWYREFPYTFPTFSVDEVTFTYDSSSRVVTRDGTPFGSNAAGEDIEDYLWSVSVYNSEGTIVHSSAPIKGVSNEYTIPSDTFESGESYTAKVFAQSLDRVSGYPAFVVESEATSL